MQSSSGQPPFVAGALETEGSEAEPAPQHLWFPPIENDRRDLVLYLIAGAIYITIGVFLLEFMLASVVALGYLLIAVWIVPALYRKLR